MVNIRVTAQGIWNYEYSQTCEYRPLLDRTSRGGLNWQVEFPKNYIPGIK